MLDRIAPTKPQAIAGIAMALDLVVVLALPLISTGEVAQIAAVFMIFAFLLTFTGVVFLGSR